MGIELEIKLGLKLAKLAEFGEEVGRVVGEEEDKEEEEVVTSDRSLVIFKTVGFPTLRPKILLEFEQSPANPQTQDTPLLPKQGFRKLKPL